MARDSWQIPWAITDHALGHKLSCAADPQTYNSRPSAVLLPVPGVVRAEDYPGKWPCEIIQLNSWGGAPDTNVQLTISERGVLKIAISVMFYYFLPCKWLGRGDSLEPRVKQRISCGLQFYNLWFIVVFNGEIAGCASASCKELIYLKHNSFFFPYRQWTTT